MLRSENLYSCLTFQSLQKEVFSEILENLILYIKNCYTNKALNIIKNEISSATLLTGTGTDIFH